MMPKPEEGLACGRCNPAVIPRTHAAERAAQRYRWCVKCGSASAFFPAIPVTRGKTQASEDDGLRRCLWPGCRNRVAPHMWGCRKCWFKLPAAIRNDINAAYTPGQEKNLRLVKAEWEAANERALAWIASHERSAG